MYTRRAVRQATGTAGVAAATFGNTDSRASRPRRGVEGATPGDVAMDENFWRAIQESFTLGRLRTSDCDWQLA